MWVVHSVTQLRTAVTSPLTRNLKPFLPLFSEGMQTRSFFGRIRKKRDDAILKDKKVEVEGLEAYNKTKNEIQGKRLYVLFCGSKDPTGFSWCPDCRASEPVIDKCLKKAPKDTLMIRCGVGPRNVWKDPDNEFRKDPELRLKSVPTLVKVGTPRRLEEVQCADKNLVKMFFEED